MNNKSLLVYVFALAAGVVGCVKSDKEAAVAETDSRGIPVSVASILLSDTCQIDTLYASDENVVRMINDISTGQSLVFDNQGLVIYNPLLQVDSLAESTYRISDLLSDVVVNFSEPRAIDKIRKVFPIYDEFSIKAFEMTSGIKDGRAPMIFSMAVSAPTDKLTGADALNSAIAFALDSTKYEGSYQKIAQYMSSKFFSEYEDEILPWESFMRINKLAYRLTPKYVTFFDTYTWYIGGSAHGMYGFDFPTYAFDDKMFVTNEYLFIPDSDDDILKAIYEALAANEDFATNHNISTAAQAELYVRTNLGGELSLPVPGIVDDCFVFCFQPYDLGSYMEGSYQLKVPVKKLKPYLTDKAKKLLS